ncbi:MAG TPA: anion transporter [Methylomirabilota bacterium]|jgi:Na+/H+ antiporter NhaD/arsenite permease-like protein|nr:anion transporter [Methylomirabilota bacterium]
MRHVGRDYLGVHCTLVPDIALTRVIALAALIWTYIGLTIGRVPGLRVDRTGVAIIGAAVVVVTGVVPWDRAVASVDAHTLALLFGMMIVSAYLRLSGFFHLVTLWAVRRARTPAGLLAALIGAAGVLSAVFVNDVICLVLAPLVLRITRQLRLPPVPYLIALATAANVGSVATLTGNPQNMLVGSFSGLSYRSFLFREAPVALIGLVCVFGIVWLVYRSQLGAVIEPGQIETHFAVHYPLMIKTVLGVLVMLVAFLAGVPVALVALGGAAYTLLTRRVKPAKVYREINWELLVLFTGLFVLIGGLEATGLTGELFRWTAAAHLHHPAMLTAVSAVLSNLVSNVPAVLLFKSIIPTFAEPARGWLILAMASTLAGNLTLFGSVANLIVVEVARGARVELHFLEYSRVGVPLTLVTLLVGWLVLSLLPV